MNFFNQKIHKGERVILKGECPVDIQVSEPRRGRESKFLRLQS